MTFKELTNQLQREGWRAYIVPNISSPRLEKSLHTLSVRNLFLFQVYEGQHIIFVKTFFPPLDVQKLDSKPNKPENEAN